PASSSISGSAAWWWPRDDAAAPTAAPTALPPAAPPDDIALEARLPTPAAIESYQAACRVGVYGSGGASSGSTRESVSAWAARCSAMLGAGASGRPGLRLNRFSLAAGGGTSGWPDISIDGSEDTAPAGRYACT